MAGPVGHHVDDVDPSVGVGQHGILLSAVWYRPAPDDQTGPKRTLQYIIAIFSDFFKGLSQKNEKNMTFFLRKSPPRSVHFCENKNF